jgi:hypothetical protein
LTAGRSGALKTGKRSAEPTQGDKSMILKKVLLVASAAALMSTPAWALPGDAPSNQGTAQGPSTTPVGPPSTTPNNTDNPGSSHRHDQSGAGDQDNNDHHGSGESGSSHKPNHPGQSHKCKPHRVGYVAAGTLVSQTLTKDASGNTYSGEVTVTVLHANHHAAGDVNATTPKTYKVENVRVTFGLDDTNNDGSVGLDDLQEGGRVRLLGGITRLGKHCNQEGFTATTTIRRIVFHAPATPAS